MDAILQAARGITGDDDFISSLQASTCYSMTAARGCSTPLDSPALHDALVVRSFDVNEGMGITEIEFDDFARQLDFLGAIVCCGNGMMCVGRQTEQQGDDDCEDRNVTF